MIFFKYISNEEMCSYTFLGINIYLKQKKFQEKIIFFNGLIKIIKGIDLVSQYTADSLSPFKFSPFKVAALQFHNKENEQNKLRQNNKQVFVTVKYIKLFNKTIYKKINNIDYNITYLFNIPIKIELLKDFYKKQINNTIDNKYDDIYILTSHAGEAYVFLTYFLNGYLKINKSQNPIIVTKYKYLNDIIEMVCPEIPHIYLDKLPILFHQSFEINGKRFFQIYDLKFYANQIRKNNRSKNPISYYELCKNWINIPDNMIFVNPIKITEKIENSMTEKISKIGLNTDNFIFISPEAKTLKMLPQKFWDEIIEYYKDKGIDIYLNINNRKFNEFDKYCKTIDLTFSEAFALAKKAKKIITLRSGLSEILMQTGVKHIIINTCPMGLKTFRINKNLPLINVNTNHEYLISEIQTQKELDKVKEIILNDKIDIEQ